MALDYTSLDLSFFTDRKIRRLRRKCGNESPLVYIALLCIIFKEGYYIEADDDIVMDISDMTGLDETEVSGVLDACLEVGLIDRAMYEKNGIITSVGIQRRYETACEKSKRKSRVTKFSLISSEDSPKNASENRESSEFTPINSEETPISSEVTPENDPKKGESSEFMPQRNKEKEKKENYSSSLSSSEQQEEQELFFLKKIFFNNWGSPGAELAKFIAYNNLPDAKGWNNMSFQEKDAAFSFWKQKPAQKPRMADDALALWYTVYDGLERLAAPLDTRFAALDDSIAISNTADTLVIHCAECVKEFIERNLDTFKPAITAYQRTKRLCKLSYILPE